jgi:hypothetical protein
MKTPPLGVAGISFRVEISVGCGAVCRAGKSIAEFVAVGEIIIHSMDDLENRRPDRSPTRRSLQERQVFYGQLRLATTPGGTEKRGGKQRDA